MIKFARTVGLCTIVALGTALAAGQGGAGQNGHGQGRQNGQQDGQQNGQQMMTMQGTVSSVNDQDSTIVLEENGMVDTLQIDTATQIMRNGEEIELNELQEDTDVTVEYRMENGERKITSITEGQQNGGQQNGGQQNGQGGMNGQQPQSGGTPQGKGGQRTPPR